MERHARPHQAAGAGGAEKGGIVMRPHPLDICQQIQRYDLDADQDVPNNIGFAWLLAGGVALPVWGLLGWGLWTWLG